MKKLFYLLFTIFILFLIPSCQKSNTSIPEPNQDSISIPTTEPTPTAITATTTDTEGLLAYWTFDEGKGDIAKDSSGNNHDAIFSMVTYTDGRYGKAVNFNGTEGIIRSEFKIDQKENSTGATFCAWVYPTSISEGKHQVISFDNGEFDWSLLRDGDKWHIFNGDDIINTEIPVELNKWQFVAAVFIPGEGVYFYKNDKSFHIPTISYEEDTNSLGIGENPADEYEEYFQGKIDEVRIYNRPLSEKELEQIMEMDNSVIK